MEDDPAESIARLILWVLAVIVAAHMIAASLGVPLTWDRDSVPWEEEF